MAKKSKEQPNPEYIVESKDLWKIYEEGKPIEVQALKGVNFQVKKGEIVAVMGESGSGKTTLLNCISGIDEVTRGSVFINGEDLAKMKDRKKTKYRAKNMGFVFQTFNLIPVLSALENVELPMLVAGKKAKPARKKAKELLELVGLGDRMNHRPNELSGGQRQRVTIARSLANDPAVIWADEPTGNLDSKTANEVMEIFTKVNKELGATIVMVTHSDEISKYAGRIVRMESGEIK
jgi:putative ABC transport system ATP-binding protein